MQRSELPSYIFKRDVFVRPYILLYTVRHDGSPHPCKQAPENSSESSQETKVGGRQMYPWWNRAKKQATEMHVICWWMFSPSFLKVVFWDIVTGKLPFDSTAQRGNGYPCVYRYLRYRHLKKLYLLKVKMNRKDFFSIIRLLQDFHVLAYVLANPDNGRSQGQTEQPQR